MDLYRSPIESDAGQTAAEYCSLIVTWILILLNVDQNSVAIFGQAYRRELQYYSRPALFKNVVITGC